MVMSRISVSWTQLIHVLVQISSRMRKIYLTQNQSPCWMLIPEKKLCKKCRATGSLCKRNGLTSSAFYCQGPQGQMSGDTCTSQWD